MIAPSLFGVSTVVFLASVSCGRGGGIGAVGRGVLLFSHSVVLSPVSLSQWIDEKDRQARPEGASSRHRISPVYGEEPTGAAFAPANFVETPQAIPGLDTVSRTALRLKQLRMRLPFPPLQRASSYHPCLQSGPRRQRRHAVTGTTTAHIIRLAVPHQNTFQIPRSPRRRPKARSTEIPR